MINPDAEVNRLRSWLGGQGWMPTEINDICDLAANDINEIILDIVSNAVAEATDYAMDLGAEEFVEDMDVIESGGGFMVTTRSGKTDYSTPERKMLNDLLKNADISEDGDRYKVVPVGGKTTVTQPRDIFTVLQQRDSVLQEARQTLNQQGLEKRSAKAQTMAGHFRGIISKKLDERMAALKDRKTEVRGTPEFRTVSDKQDENQSWVIPAKELDMTGYLMDMNRRVQDSVYSSVMFIVESYEKEFG